ncbi:uncharacterized protein LOC113004129 [Solenopsis invicta]|uniref:uncharacterized protein LOC113004129 n=1 Tax=Solenopsis invicta TaxID=13686 RepID=UPI00193D47B2|nr:uncharacterized protein LOC113004129 [Solenopsis invicta]
MEQLGQIPTIKQKIATASRAVIVVMHKFIFEEDGDRNNRRRLREFRGFEFSDDSAEFRAKLQYAMRFSIGDLISICNILDIAYNGNAEQLRERIVRALMDIGSLQSTRTRMTRRTLTTRVMEITSRMIPTGSTMKIMTRMLMPTKREEAQSVWNEETIVDLKEIGDKEMRIMTLNNLL